jgi:antitoxin ParD1/3/4
MARGGEAMETLNIALPPTMKAFIQEQVDQGGYSSASEYIRRLVREDQERHARLEIDRKLLEALDSGSAAPWTPQDLEGLKQRVRQRHPQLPDDA